MVVVVVVVIIIRPSVRDSDTAHRRKLTRGAGKLGSGPTSPPAVIALY